MEGESLAHFLCPCRPWSWSISSWGCCLCDSLNSWCVTGIFLRNSNWGLRYGGAPSPEGIIRVAVVGTEFWGFSVKREGRTATWRQRGKYGTLWPPWISQAAVLVGQGEQQQRPSYGVPEEQKWRQAAWKAGHKAVLGEPSYPPGSGQGTERDNNHHLSHSGLFWVYCVFPHSCIKQNTGKEADREKTDQGEGGWNGDLFLRMQN